MSDNAKTQKQLIQELQALRQAASLCACTSATSGNCTWRTGQADSGASEISQFAHPGADGQSDEEGSKRL